MVTLSVDGDRKQCRVAPLVLEAFVGPRPPGMDCCHDDGDSTNDALSNLRWDTKRANQADTLRHGRHWQSNKTACPLGHNLAAPNLVRQDYGRTCRACRDTHGWARHYNIRRDDLRWKNEADQRYREILSQSGRYAPDRGSACPRGHVLQAPNLVARDEGKACLTCSNTRAWAYYQHPGMGPDDPVWLAEAERRYAEIMSGRKPAANGEKTHCPRDHRLEPPNLRGGKGRRCLACSGAQSWAYGRGIPVDDPRWSAEADRRYAAIMATATGQISSK
jgi:hypothetical protein